MDRLTKWILITIGASLLLVAFLFLFVERVPVRTYGVKQFVWGGGMEEGDYTTGYHLGITGIHKWHLLDSSTHFLEFIAADGETPGGAGGKGRSPSFGTGRGSFYSRGGGADDFSTPAHRRLPALEIRNRDGNIVTVDVSVPYRIIPGEAYKIVKDGQKASYQERVKATVESMLREVIPEMSNDDILDTAKRLATSQKALDALNRQLSHFHVKADGVLIRRVAFPPEYEEKLQAKQFLTQKASLDQAETLKLGEVLRTGTIEKEITAAEALSSAEWEKKMETLRTEFTLQIATINAEVAQYSRRTRSEAEAVYQKKVAEGKLAIDKTEALLSQLRSEALASAGGPVYVAHLAAESLNLGRVTLNASDPRVPLVLDLQQLTQLLMGSSPPPPSAPGGD